VYEGAVGVIADMFDENKFRVIKMPPLAAAVDGVDIARLGSIVSAEADDDDVEINLTAADVDSFDVAGEEGRQSVRKKNEVVQREYVIIITRSRKRASEWEKMKMNKKGV
jgi:hypothetical protein